MRVRLDAVHVAEHALDQMPRLDQLTVVRNMVRRGIDAHRQSADGDSLTEAVIEVAWIDGDVEDLVFDLFVGFPTNIERDWYAEWKSETRA